MGADKNIEPCRIAEVLGDYAKHLAPIERRCGSLREAWEQTLPAVLQAHCQIVAIAGGCLKVATDSPSYMYELQLCKTDLLKELQRLCPGAAIRRLQVAMGDIDGR